MQQLPVTERDHVLESMRGIAAVTVVLNHFLVAMPFMPWLVGHGLLGLILARSPLRSLWSGYEAVMFFFVLSGFVLAAPFFRQPRPYPAFVVKRVFRIYPAYVVTVVLAMAGATVLGRTLAGPPPWPWVTWRAPVTWSAFLDHLVMIRPFDSWAFDPVLWSLVQEMRISLIFPLLVLVVSRYGWLRSLILGLAVAVQADVLQWRGTSPDVAGTPEYLVVFLIGIVLARHRQELIERFRLLGPARQRLLALAAVLAYSYRYWFLPQELKLHPLLLNDLLPALAAGTAIVAACSLTRLRSVLLAGPLRFLGSISYSLYLLHAVVLLAALYAVTALRLPLWLAWPAAGAGALSGAWLCQRFVERPFIALGGRLAARLPRLAGDRPTMPRTGPAEPAAEIAAHV